MRYKNKPPVVEPPPLCRAVKSVRNVAQLSQEKFAQQLAIHTQTISRFERGRQIPADAVVLTRLRDAADRAKCEPEAQLFRDAIAAIPQVIWTGDTELEKATGLLRRRLKLYPAIQPLYREIVKAVLRGAQELEDQFWLRAPSEPVIRSMGFKDMTDIGAIKEALQKELAALNEVENTPGKPKKDTPK